MDEDEREYSSENEAEEMVDEMADEADDMEAEADNEHDGEEENEEDEDASEEAEHEDGEAKHEASHDEDVGPSTQGACTPAHPWAPRPRPETVTARIYDIVPTMAAPQATSINALAITPDLRYWMTGGSDGYIRKYDGLATINGKQLLTVAQRHPFVDSVVKAGMLMSYWENEEPSAPGTRPEERVLSPIYSLAVHSGALWLLSGLESGGINLQSVRHDEGKKIHVLKDGGHTNAVSALVLAPDEKSVLSGSWDKTMLDWSLDTGHIIRRYEGSGGQISAIELRPDSGALMPPEASEVDVRSETMQMNEYKPPVFVDGVDGAGPDATAHAASHAPGSPEHESLFGSPAGSLFGDNDNMGGGGGGGGAFGNDDDDEEFSTAMDMTLHDDAENHSMHESADLLGDTDMADTAPTLELASQNADEIPVDKVSNGHSTSGPTQDWSQQTLEEPAAPSRSTSEPPAEPDVRDTPSSPSMLLVSGSADPSSQTSSTTFLSAAIDGTLRIWDRRMANPAARINQRAGVAPWCMGACWSSDGNAIYVGRRNATVEEFSIHRATGRWAPERTLKFPAGSGAVSCVRAMPNGRHLMCASHDILRLYNLRDQGPASRGHSSVPFTIVPGPPRAGVISCLYLDPTARIMVTAAGHRGWEGSCTEVLIGYEIGVSS